MYMRQDRLTIVVRGGVKLGESWLTTRGGSEVSDTRPAILEAVYMPLVSVGWRLCMYIIPSLPPEKLFTLLACHVTFKKIEIFVSSLPWISV